MATPPARQESAKDWLRSNGHDEVARKIDALEAKWTKSGKATRRNWWSVLAGTKDGAPRMVDGVAFPVIQEVRVRQGMPATAKGAPHPLTDALVAKLSGTAAPFLFVGSGLSRRFLGLPDWGGLLRHFCSAVGRDYNYYLSAANGDYPRLASRMAPDFHRVWWKSKNFEASRKAAGHQMQQVSDPLKYEVAEFLRQAAIAAPSDPKLAAEFDSLGRAVVDGVITTNWDLLLEHRFANFTPYVGQDQLLFAPTYGVGEIYKIHGCCTDFRSLELTEEDYAGRRLR
jgi:hypothetical protein